MGICRQRMGGDKMKIYVACHCQEEAKKVASRLSSAGYEITSSWLQEDMNKKLSDAERQNIALKDVKEVESSDCLVMIGAPTGCHVPGGKHVEAGVAIANAKPILLLGRKENIFYWHPLVFQFDDINKLLDQIEIFNANKKFLRNG